MKTVLIRQSDMLFTAPKNSCTRGQLFFLCAWASWIVKVIRIWWWFAVVLCFSDFLLCILLPGQTCCCHIYGLRAFSARVSPFFSFVITAKPEPFVTVHFEQLLFSSSNTHTRTQWYCKCHTHFILLSTILIWTVTEEDTRKSTISKNCTWGFS